MTIGVFDAELHARYRGLPEGPEKRRLHNRLVVENTPLLKTMLAQVTGKGALVHGRKSAAAKMAGCAGFEDIEPDDLFQLGLIALAKAIEKLDTTRGKLPYCLALWLRNYLRRDGVEKLFLIHTPEKKGHLRPGLGLVGLPSDDQDRAGSDERGFYAPQSTFDEILESENVPKGERLVEAGSDWEGAVDADALRDDPEFVAAAQAFAETGVWPVALESTAAFMATRPKAPVVYSVARPSWECFLVTQCVVSPLARTPRGAFGEAYEAFCGASGRDAVDRAELYQRLGGMGIRETRVRVGESIRGLAGVRLTTKSRLRIRAYRRATRAPTDHEMYLRNLLEWEAGAYPKPARTAAAVMFAG